MRTREALIELMIGWRGAGVKIPRATAERVLDDEIANGRIIPVELDGEIVGYEASPELIAEYGEAFRQLDIIEEDASRATRPGQLLTAAEAL